GMYEYDANLVFLDWRAAQALFGLEKAVSGTAFSLREAEDAGRVKTLLQRKLGFPYFVRTWMDMNKTLFGALKLEKIVMFLILALIILVASLNIAGSLTILVMDKTKDIGVLKALGAAKWDLVRIFTMDGLFLGGAGALAGLLAGMGISWVLKTYPVVELPKEIYYTNRLPVQMDWADAFLVAGVAMALSLASAFYPARLASKLDVVKALRYE
ncbi:MAG: ABC transporter permease, partial [Candidatus Omnitrophica bacterium]|nr:ABC transporter permease [Candidatus Omnitrophota bacterium]